MFAPIHNASPLRIGMLLGSLSLAVAGSYHALRSHTLAERVIEKKYDWRVREFVLGKSEVSDIETYRVCTNPAILHWFGAPQTCLGGPHFHFWKTKDAFKLEYHQANDSCSSEEVALHTVPLSGSQDQMAKQIMRDYNNIDTLLNGKDQVYFPEPIGPYNIRTYTFPETAPKKGPMDIILYSADCW
jgi:hypothetical protein